MNWSVCSWMYRIRRIRCLQRNCFRFSSASRRTEFCSRCGWWGNNWNNGRDRLLRAAMACKKPERRYEYGATFVGKEWRLDDCGNVFADDGGSAARASFGGRAKK